MQIDYNELAKHTGHDVSVVVTGSRAQLLCRACGCALLSLNRHRPEDTDTLIPALFLYTDGGCSPNPGLGGWGVVGVHADRDVFEMKGALEDTTSSRMELMAAIKGLEKARGTFPNYEPTVITDSNYVKTGMNEWIKGWISREWTRSDGNPVKNQDLWQRLHDVSKVRPMAKFLWMRKDSHPRNTKAHDLATKAREELGV